MEEYKVALYSVSMGQYTLSLEKGEYLENFYIEKAKEELRENPIIKEQALQELKKFISDDHNINIPIDDDNMDQYLCAYLRVCKFYVTSALARIQFLCYCRMKYPEYFAHVIPVQEKNVFQNNLLTTLPKRDQHGRRILIAQIGKKWKPNECSLAEIIRGITLLTEGAMLEPRTQVSGAVLILDVEGFNLQHVLQFSPVLAKILLDWVQNSMPLRLKAVHVVKQSSLFNMVFAIFKPFLRQKLKNRVHLHGQNQNSLLAHVDTKYVPTYYGGSMDISLDEGIDQWNLLCKYNDIYERTSKYGYKQKPKT